MKKFITNFDTTAELAAFSATTGFTLPHVSYTKDNNQLHFFDDAIDLGLSVKWCSHNVGAESEWENGLYFSWGNSDGHAKGSGYNFNSDTYSATSGNTLTGDITPMSEYDMAHVNMGGNWRLPTKTEFQELRDGCNWVWTTSNGISGYRVTSKTNGNSIFIPAVGYYYDTSLYYDSSNGFYLSSSFYNSSNAYYLFFGSSNINPQSNESRYFGFSARAVQ